MVAPTQARGVTVPEIAQRYSRSPRTVHAWTRRPDWPAPLGRRARDGQRGSHLEYDAAAVDTLVRSRILGPAPDTTDPRRLLTASEVAERAGVAYKTLTSYVSRGQFPAPDDVGEAKWWRQSTVDAWISNRKRWHGAS